MAEALNKPTREELLAEVEKGVSKIESRRPRRLDGFAVSDLSKLPFKALNYSDSLIWRMSELSTGALASLRAGNVVTGILLTRAAFETSAALWYLSAKLENAVQAGDVGDIDNYLTRLAVGWKAQVDMPQAINVMTFLARVEKDIPGFTRNYDMLCEFCHPNWAGTTFIYTRFDPQMPGVAEYGNNIRGLDSPITQALGNLSGALMMFNLTYKQLSEMTSRFTAVCEKNCLAIAASGVTAPEK